MLNDNKAVKTAYEKGTYTDARGRQWRRGMDGWFLVHDGDGIFLARHHDMIAMIEKERPDKELG